MQRYSPSWRSAVDVVGKLADPTTYLIGGCYNVPPPLVGRISASASAK